ncbi:MAG: DUF2934 domain-containing protein [Gallionella sp.]
MVEVTKKPTVRKVAASKASAKTVVKTAATVEKAPAVWPFPAVDAALNEKKISAGVKKTAVKKSVSKKAEVKKPVTKKAVVSKTVTKQKVAQPSDQERYRMVETAAYYIAERSDFQGSALSHWAQAEIEIANKLAS